MDDLTARTRDWLREMCESYPDRHVGGPGNRAACEMFVREAAALGYEVETAELDCLDWERGPSVLHVAGQAFEVFAGPYSPYFEGTVPLASASDVDQLESGGFEGALLLVHGELAAHQLMPKGFPFYNPDSHRRIVSALERSGAAAVVAATGMDPDLAGGLSPFPLLDDGGFLLPSAYMRDHDGERLLSMAGEEVFLRISSRRVPAKALQPVARKRGSGEGRVLLVGHIDSKIGSPGALDNAAGAVAILGAAALLADYEGPRTIEVLPFNGEDHYAVTGHMWWLARNEGRLGDVVAALNVDGAGFAGQPTAVSLYGMPDAMAAVVREETARHGFAEGPQWPQGDHMIFAMAGRPAVAVTSENVFFIASTVAHTERDTLENVDAAAVAEVARFLADVARGL